MKKIDHIAVAVKSIDEMQKLFTELLGVEPEFENIPSENVNTAVFTLDDISIELIEPLGEEGPINRFIEKRGNGLHHICFEVDNIEDALKEYSSKGFEAIDSTPKKGTGGKQIVFLQPKTTGGILIELNSIPTETRKSND